MELLQSHLDVLIQRLENSETFKLDLEKLRSVFPFNRFEYIISTLLAHGKITFDDYIDIRDEYINRNLFLHLFEMAPRTFGDTWGLSQICNADPDFKRPSKRSDACYTGEYDLYLDWTDTDSNNHNIKIEVKASRATDRERKEEPLVVKASASNSDRPFLMNFQQQKPSCCDVFIWIAVYRDTIKYWALNADAVQTNKFFRPQHRNAATADRGKEYDKADIFEGQIFVTNENVGHFDGFIASVKNIKEAVIDQYKIQKGLN